MTRIFTEASVRQLETKNKLVDAIEKGPHLNPLPEGEEDAKRQARVIVARQVVGDKDACSQIVSARRRQGCRLERAGSTAPIRISARATPAFPRV